MNSKEPSLDVMHACMHGCAENVDVCTAEWHNHTDQLKHPCNNRIAVHVAIYNIDKVLLVLYNVNLSAWCGDVVSLSS